MRRNALELEVFAGQEKSELSMIEVARAILELRGRDHEMHFSDLVNEIQNYLGTSNSDIREALPLFYTELNFDGSSSHLETINGVFVHGMVWTRLTKKSSLLKKMTTMKCRQKLRKNSSMLYGWRFRCY